jgi:hypothetical protein
LRKGKTYYKFDKKPFLDEKSIGKFRLYVKKKPQQDMAVCALGDF